MGNANCCSLCNNGHPVLSYFNTFAMVSCGAYMLKDAAAVRGTCSLVTRLSVRKLCHLPACSYPNLWIHASLQHPWAPAQCRDSTRSYAGGVRCHNVQAESTLQQQSRDVQLPRFYAPQLPSAAGVAIELEPDEAKHAVRVLRLKPGDAVELCNGQGGLVHCEVAYTSKNSATVVAAGFPQTTPWQGPKWVLAAACLTLKGGRADWLVEKATELGAYAVLPVIAQRSQTGTTKNRFQSLSTRSGSVAAGSNSRGALEAHDSQPSRLQRLALAATKQSLRAHAMHIQPATALPKLLPALQQSAVSLVATAGAPPVLQVLQQKLSQHQSGVSGATLQDQQQHSRPWQVYPCYLLIGPEGDFTCDELDMLQQAGVLPVGLGPNRLRTETAAVALLAAATMQSDALRQQ